MAFMLRGKKKKKVSKHLLVTPVLLGGLDFYFEKANLVSFVYMVILTFLNINLLK